MNQAEQLMKSGHKLRDYEYLYKVLTQLKLQ